MNNIEKSFEILQLVYTIIPFEVFMIVMSGLVFWLYTILTEKNNDHKENK